MKQNRLYLTLALVFYAIGGAFYQAMAQSGPPQQTVSGKVTDDLGPITGVNVILLGQNNGTFTDREGQYSLMASSTDTLVFTYLGYKTVTIPVGNRTQIDVRLQEEATALQEVEVNAGYYTVKERERTGSISRVTAEEIELQPIVSPLEALQGRMAGVEVVQRSGVPGSAPIIRIRGQNSLRADGNYPLYIIDGVPINSAPVEGGSNIYPEGIDPLSTLNLSNIQSIEVLKDADATAIYGSRGANGVVLITTKKGTGYNQGTELEVGWYTGLGKVSKKMNLLNTEQYLTIRRAALENDGRTPTETADYDLLIWDQNRYTDWQEELFGGTSTITDINVSASGGNATTAFRFGGSYHKEGMVFPGDNGYHKITSGLNLNHISENKKLGINLSINYGIDRSDVYSDGGTNFISTALALPPNAPKLYNEDGSLHWEEWGYSDWSNPLAGVLYRTITDNGYNIIVNSGFNYELFKGAVFKTNFGYTDLNRNAKGKISNKLYSPEIRDYINHVSVENTRRRRSWILEPQLAYRSQIGEGSIDGLLGLTFQQNDSKELFAYGEGYVSELLMGDLSAAETVRITDNKHIKYKYNAIFARLGYNWNKKYFLNLTGRRDGSSRFGPNKRFANFWAVGGSWIFTEENFIKQNIPFLSFGKLRGSYGTTGSDQIGDYAYLDYYEPTSGPNGLYPTQLTNPDYSWEENRKIEAAIQLGFLNDRILVGANWYRNRSSNQLVGIPLPSITGFNSVQANLPATVQNTGWEIELSTINLDTEHFHWQTSLNLTIPNNKLIRFPKIDQTSYNNIYRIGYPLNIAFLYQYDGIDPETGLYRIKDVNSDGNYDFQDRSVIRNMGRIFFGGLNNNLSYKSIGFQFLWEFVKQDSFSQNIGIPGFVGMQSEDYFNSWQGGANNNIQKISQSTEALIAYYNAFESERFITDTSFLRLRNVSISYNIPKAPLETLGLISCKVFLQAQNLLTITKYNGLNVEFPGGNTIPSLRTIVLGVQFNF